MNRCLPLLALLLAACSSKPPATDTSLPDVVDYNYHIKPILSDRCYTCHGPDENTREAGLRLDTEAGFSTPLGKAGNYVAVVPGKPEKSELIRRIVHTNPEEVMPPPESNLALSPHEIALIYRWVEQGAEWKPHWSFISPEKPDAPAVADAAWPANDIDRFVLARLDSEGLAPAPEASLERLLRRVTFDLTGLPPSPGEIDAFLEDTSPNAYERVVDRLLASPAYGERMANEWLDVARYADTGGYQSDRLTHMWPWRDWVVSAFNRNLPYDDFLTWQLAGDLLPDATQEQILATGFNRNHRQTEEGGSIEEEFRAEYVADRVNTLGTAVLGLTLECARCHDHKYDPVTQKEYYQFFSYFNQIDESGQTSFFTDAVPVPTLLRTDAETDSALADVRRRIPEAEEALKTAAADAEEPFQRWKESFQPSSLPARPPPGPVDAFGFERLGDTTLPNDIRPGRPAKLLYDPSLVEGKMGQAMVFDGENGVEAAGVGDFERTDPFTISFWMKPARWNPWNVLVHHTKAALDAGSRGYEIALQGNQLVAGLAHMWPQNAIRVVTTDSLVLGAWTHVAAIYDGSSRAAGLTLYVNGEPAAVEVVRDNLFKNIRYERTEVGLTVGFRFRDAGFKDGLIDELAVYDRALTPIEAAQLAGIPAPADEASLRAHFLAHHSPGYTQAQRALRQLREEENERVSAVEEIMVMRDMAERRPAYVLVRGQYDQKGEEVQPATPAFLPAADPALPPNRLGLAQWLTAPEHPLTARVAVNRMWQLFFGMGLVATPDDFGNQGQLPSHPELLDWLATDFVDSGWDVKRFVKQIVVSATYRQASEASPELRERDPGNALLARGPGFRLPAEMLRDNALAASGLLVNRVGGPPVKPYQPAGIWEEKSGAKYVQDTGESLYRRSLYTFWKRTSPPPAMTTFDAPERNSCLVQRQRTSTPMQALVLLNDPQFVEAARKVGERMWTEAGADRATQIVIAFRLLTGEMPSDAERAVLETIYQEQYDEYAGRPDAARQLLAIGESSRETSIDPASLAAATMVASAIMNYDAAVMRR
ncbi:MAG: DUF1553 domain-containing protein [Rhodothermales bacterium]|nr:DUF1553 domain-containing protein [Rhodothermales bacterium]